MEAFRVRNATPGQQRRLLLPISGGISSGTLLHVLNGYLEAQLTRTGRPGFELHVVHVVEDSETASSSSIFESTKQRYPRLQYHILQLSDSQDSPEANGTAQKDESSNPGRLIVSELLPTLTSPTSRVDVSTIARSTAIVKAAQRLDCEGVLWGDTTTRLAEKILSETAKGRGYSLPWLVNDGESPHGVTFLFPMRELFKKELLPFAASVGLPYRDDEIVAPTSTKDSSIDMLMKQYFQSVEVNYPSIVANVVRTSSKLIPLAEDASSSPCRLCGMLVAEGTLGILGWGGYARREELHQATSVAVGGEHGLDLCYGCARSTLGSAVER